MSEIKAIPIPGKILIKFKPGVSDDDKEKFLKRHGLTITASLRSFTAIEVLPGQEDYWVKQIRNNDLIEEIQRAMKLEGK